MSRATSRATLVACLRWLLAEICILPRYRSDGRLSHQRAGSTTDYGQCLWVHQHGQVVHTFRSVPALFCATLSVGCNTHVARKCCLVWGLRYNLAVAALHAIHDLPIYYSALTDLCRQDLPKTPTTPH